MSKPHLIGPVNRANADFVLRLCSSRPGTITFGEPGLADIAVEELAWTDHGAPLAGTERPEAVIALADFGPIPAAVRHAPVAVLAVAGVWRENWHRFRDELATCDRILTDPAGVSAFTSAGLTNAQPSIAPWAIRRIDPTQPSKPELDLLVCWRPGIHPVGAGKWLDVIASLRNHWRIAFRPSTGKVDFLRARAVLYLGQSGEYPAIAADAAEVGAALLLPANSETKDIPLTDTQDYLGLSVENASCQLNQLLKNEPARVELVNSLRDKLNGLHARFWDEVTITVEERDPRPLAQSRGPEHIAAPALRLIGSSPGTSDVWLKAADLLSRALEFHPTDPIAGWMRAELLAAAGKLTAAIDQARQTLLAIDSIGDLPHEWLFGLPTPPSAVRWEWERAGWENAGRSADELTAKRAIIRTQLHALLSTLTSDLSHAYEAAVGNSSNDEFRVELGVALTRAGRPAQAVEHLRRAHASNPFSPAARTLHTLLVRLGHDAVAEQLRKQQATFRAVAPGLIRPEAWVTPGEKPPPLVSIIILCCGQIAFTRLCLESVLRNTRQPYELILIDNGSTDGTADYLRSFGNRLGPTRVEVILNATNRGFPAGCNQGLSRAAGEYVLFLNNDTIVPNGWLDTLVAVAARDASGRSLVGAVTNNASPPHPVPVTYRTLDGIEPFAERWAAEHRREIAIVSRLSAFCLLGKRSFIASLGGFDERYGIGLFDDDDLCLRAKAAGAELVLAHEVFVHHFGSRTFHGLAVDGPKQLAENFRRFAEKWGPGVAAGYHLPNQLVSTPATSPQDVRQPQPVPASPLSPRKPQPGDRVSLCMIVKNEEPRLARCLGSVADLVNEIVVADTGSTDRTKEIAVQFGAKVVDVPWTDSFSAARNASIQHATCRWIFWMDADDFLDNTNREKLQTLFQSLPDRNAAYLMRIVSEETGGANGKVVDHVRVFRNLPTIRWEYRVHEQILRAITASGGREEWTDIVIRHTGYQDPATCRRKHDRNLRLLHLEAQDRPDDPFTLFNLGWTCQVLGRTADAVNYLERGLTIVRPGVSFARKMYAVLINTYRRLGRPADAIKWSRRGLELYPNDTELLYQNAMLSYEGGDLLTAEKHLRRLLEPRPPAYFAIGVDEGLTGYLARYNLGVVARDLGRLAEAEQFWRAAVAERPDYAAAWVGLAELFATAARWQDLERTIRELESDSLRKFEALLVRARGAIGRDTTAALSALTQAAALRPDSIWPPLLRSHVYLQSGGDLEAAEKALLDVLALDPSHHQSRVNLDRVRALKATVDQTTGAPSE